MTIKHLSIICAALSILFTGCSGEEDSPQSVRSQEINDILAQIEKMTPEEARDNLERLANEWEITAESAKEEARDNLERLANEQANNATSSIESETPDDPGSTSSPDESRSLEPDSELVVEEATSQATADSSLEKSAVEPDTPTPPSAEILQKARQVSQLNSEAIKKIQSGDKSAY